MKFFYCSDLHLEYESTTNIKLIFSNEHKQDFLLLAGDICQLSNETLKDIYIDFLSYCSKLFKEVIIITGNHEYYGSVIEETNLWIQNVIQKSFDNVHFLNQTGFNISPDVRIIGATLWSSVRQKSISIADYSQIKGFTVDTGNQLHDENKNFILNEIKESQEKKQKLIVMTHHLPSFDLIAEEYKHYRTINEYFATNLSPDEFFEYPKYWIFGHSHVISKKTQINKTIFCTNTFGYPNESKIQNSFSLNSYFEL